MEPSAPQMIFLTDLRRGACRAGAHLDAAMVGPLIRAGLVRWDDEPGDAAQRRQPPSTMFTLSALGECLLAARDAGPCHIVPSA